LGFAIGLVDKAALWATPDRVARIPDDMRNASEVCPAGQELAKLTKRLPMQRAALRLPGLARLRMCGRPSRARARPALVIDSQPASRLKHILGTFTSHEQRPVPAVNGGVRGTDNF
jgi:hypothetical protein